MRTPSPLRTAAAVLAYRFRRTARRSLAGGLGLVVLIALTGGVAMAALAGARRTASSLPAFMASTHPSQLTVLASSVSQDPTPYSASLTRKLAALPGVVKVEAAIVPANLGPLDAKGLLDANAPNAIAPLASVDGLNFDMDRLTPTSGRFADPDAINEIMIDPDAARLLHWHVGSRPNFGLWRPSQETTDMGTARPTTVVHAIVVGIVRANDSVIEDDFQHTEGTIYFTPALAKRTLAGAWATTYSFQLRDPARTVPEVEAAYKRLIKQGSSYNFTQASERASRVQRAIAPEAAALAVFGLIATAIALVVCGLAVGRQVRAGADDRRVLRSMGASPLLSALDGLPATGLALLLGTAAAVAVAIGLSTLSPVGPVRPLYPTRGPAADWFVLGLGALVLVVVLTGVAVLVALRLAPHRDPRVHGSGRGSTAAGLAAALGLPNTVVLGTRFALEPGAGRQAVPVRSVLAGTIIGVTTLVATLSFASGLHTLIQRPSLYGWNWNVAVSPGGGQFPLEDMARLRRDPDVESVWGVENADVSVDGLAVPSLLSDAPSALGPTMLTGSPVRGSREVVLGPKTLADLHKRVGDTVTIQYGTRQNYPVYVPPTKVRIVGSATFPAYGFTLTSTQSTTLGAGAWLPISIEPPALVKALTLPDPLQDGWNVVFVRFRPGVTTARGRASLLPITRVVDIAQSHDPAIGDPGSVSLILDVQRPAEIVDYRSVGATPVIFAGGLALGASVALAISLVASVRRRRRDLALLKALGVSARQISAMVLSQALVIAVVGVVVGVPLGIIAGRQLWIVFARTIDVLPQATVPAVQIVWVAVGTLVFAAVVALLPGRSAGRTPTALVLRAE